MLSIKHKMAEREALLLDSLDENESGSNVYRRFQRYWSRRLAPAAPMSPVERAVLNPIEKWQRYGRIPWKLTVHLLLVVATTVMVVMWAGNDAAHIRHSASHFHRALLGISGLTPADRIIEISSADDFKKQLDATVEGYWGIGDSKFANYSLCHEPLVVEAIYANTEQRITVELHEASWRDNEAYQRLSTQITPEVARITVQGTVHDRFQGRHWRQCLRWSLGAVFHAGGSGLVVGELQSSVAECSKDGATNVTVPLVTMALAVISLTLCSKAMYSGHGVVAGWLLFNFFANVVQVFAALSCMRLARRTDVTVRFFLLGVAAASAWISVIRYLRYFPSYYVLIRTLARAVPRCSRFVTGVIPILVGYALLGNCLFHESAMFATIGASVATLFSLLNGDIIRDTFSDIGQLRPIIGEAYLYSFLCLFIYVVLHMFISIVEEAYFTAKNHRDTHNELFLLSEDDDQELPIGMTMTASTSSGSSSVSSYVVGNVKRDLEMLQSLGQLDDRARAELMDVITRH